MRPETVVGMQQRLLVDFEHACQMRIRLTFSEMPDVGVGVCI